MILKYPTLDSFWSSRHVPYLVAPGPDAAAAAAVFLGEDDSSRPFSMEGKRFLGDDFDLVGDCDEEFDWDTELVIRNSNRRRTLSSFLLGEEKSDSASLTSLLLLAAPAAMCMRSLEPGGVVLLLRVASDHGSLIIF